MSILNLHIQRIEKNVVALLAISLELKDAKQIRIQDFKDRMLINEFNDKQSADQWIEKFGVLLSLIVYIN